ncbi:MAG: hypothetical protein A3C13_04820 [Candidatus Lloydbacteria bacterium RIFCSPHIGHO2_02_FULL_50_11]|nr:MAG: hypothetical protein A3C13_04820 [Candidatus Lloydbacteria bacterium RIFCSPHIGHO2_02_FULL_50_11]
MEMTVPAAVAATVAVYDEKNAELNYTIQVAFSETTPKAWGHYAVTFAAHVEKIGGYMLVMPKILNDFAYKCPWGASEVRTTLFARVSREYDEKLFGDKEVLVQNDRRVAAFISLTSMLAPSETEAVVKKVETAYAVAGLEVPKVVTKKVAERRKVFAELTARREERELEEIRKPFLRREWSAR